MNNALLLLVCLNVCHWFGDFTHLSTKWMLNAKQSGKPLFPIFCHAMIHSILMFIVLHFWLDNELLVFDMTDKLFFLQLGSHFMIDVLKGKLNGWFPKLNDFSNPYHWYVFGVDQFLHQSIMITMVYFAMK